MWSCHQITSESVLSYIVLSVIAKCANFNSYNNIINIVPFLADCPIIIVVNQELVKFVIELNFTTICIWLNLMRLLIIVLSLCR